VPLQNTTSPQPEPGGKLRGAQGEQLPNCPLGFVTAEEKLDVLYQNSHRVQDFSLRPDSPNLKAAEISAFIYYVFFPLKRLLSF